MKPCIHLNCNLYFCPDCGRMAQINEKFKVKDGVKTLKMWTRIWKDPQ